MSVRHARGLLAPLLWSGGAVAVAHIDGVRAKVPSLGVLIGPFGFVLLGLGASCAAWEWSKGWRERWPLPGPRALFALTFLVSALIGLHYVRGITASGDEPHYLLMAQSLWKEHDLDLRDNLERKDYAEYFPGVLEPHWGAPRADGRPFPAHSPGLPLLLAPAFALGGRSACVVLFSVLLAALGREAWAMGRLLTGDDRTAVFAWLSAVSPPTLAYSFHLYTELPSALALGLCLRLILSEARPWGAALSAAAASCLPFLHLKMIPAAVALGLVGLLRLRGAARLVFALVASLGALSFLLYYQMIFGTPTPLAVYGGGIPPDSPTSPILAAAGVLFDRSFGLLPYAPLALVGLAGLPLLGGWPRARMWALLLTGAAVVAPVLDWRMWWGGQCPPARFLVPLAPVAAMLVAARVSGHPEGLARWRVALLAWGIGLTVYMAGEPEARLMLNRGARPTRVWASLSGARDLGRYLPSLVADTPADRRVCVLWAAAFGALLALDALARRSPRVDGLFKGLALPLLLAILVGILVDRWARAGEDPPSLAPTGQLESRSCQRARSFPTS